MCRRRYIFKPEYSNISYRVIFSYSVFSVFLLNEVLCFSDCRAILLKKLDNPATSGDKFNCEIDKYNIVTKNLIKSGIEKTLKMNPKNFP